jgi:hypothetical protein
VIKKKRVSSLNGLIVVTGLEFGVENGNRFEKNEEIL